MAFGKVIHHNNGEALLPELVNGVRTNVAGTAGDEDFSHQTD